ncbi:MAG TPA: hypothetical protein VGY99_03375 [Candidatus Binataceae bacterium]|jgi:hypothetical protein|nr:hypothetical protein [Candidatus Binataceae bacterium]
MKELAIAAALLAGCSSITVPRQDGSARLTQFQERSRAIVAQERACKNSVEKQTKDQLTQIDASDGFTQSKMKSANDQKQRQLLQCDADAQRATDELFSKERAEYESQAQEDRDRSTLMMMLTTSRLH